MAISFTPRLDAFERMQSRPLGTNTALYRDPSSEAVGRDYKRQQSDFGLARRILGRQARAGNAQAAVGLIGLSDKAAADGVDFGGIQSFEGRQAAVAGRLAGRQQAIVDQNLAAGRARAEMGGAAPVAGAPEPVGAASVSVAPESSVDRETRRRREVTLSGGFGTGAKEKLMSRESRQVDRVQPRNNWWDKPIA